MLEILLWLNGLILLCVLVIGIGLQIPAVQTFAAQKATDFLAEKLKTRVSIGRFTTDWRSSILLKDIYIEDRNRDTLLYAGRLGLDLHILGTSRNRVKIRSVKIYNGSLKVHSNPSDSTFNFSFISEAFQSSGSDQQSSFSLKLDHVVLEQIRLLLSDPVNGNFGTVSIGKLAVNTKEFDTQSGNFDLGNIRLQNSSIFWRKTRDPESVSQNGKQRFRFTKIRVDNVKADLRDEVFGRRLVASLGNVELAADKIALEEFRADLSKFSLKDSEFRLYRFAIPAADSLSQTKNVVSGQLKNKNQEQKNWAVWLQKTRFENVRCSFDDMSMPKLPRGIDFNHLRFRDIDIKLTNLYYSQGRISGIVENVQLLEKSGFRIQSLKGNVKAGPDFIDLQKLELRTNHSIIRESVTINFATARKKHFSPKLQTTYEARFRNMQFSPRDLLYLAPDMAASPFYRKSGGRMFILNGRVYGRLRSLNFENFSLRGWSQTKMQFSGNITDLQYKNTRKLNINIRQFVTNRADLNAMLADGKSTPKFSFPERISLSGQMKSQLNHISLNNLKVTGSNGLFLQTNVTVNGPQGKQYKRVQVQKLVLTRQALLNMLPAGAVSPDMQIPPKIQFTGTYEGSSIEQFSLVGKFTTSFGDASGNVKIEPVQRFSGHISLEEFEVGKFLNEEKMLGKATGKADFRGQGYKVKTMKLHYDADFKKFVYKGETYRNIRLEGDLNQKIYQLHGNLANAALQGLGHKLKKLNPKNIDLKKADPTRLIPKKIEKKKLVPKFLRKKKKPEEEKK